MKLDQKLAEALQRRSVGKKFSLYKLSKDSGVDYGYVHRIASGKKMPSKDILSKLCKGLGCSPEEKTALYHAAGYLVPEEC